MNCKCVIMLSVNVQAWDKRAKIIIDVFLPAVLHGICQKKPRNLFSLLIAAWRVGVVMWRWSVIVYTRLCLLCFKKAWFCVERFPHIFSSSQKQPKGNSSNNVIPVWAPNRHGPFKTEQQTRSQQIKLLLPLLKHKLHIQGNDRVQLSEILRTCDEVLRMCGMWIHSSDILCVQDMTKLTLRSMW